VGDRRADELGKVIDQLVTKSCAGPRTLTDSSVTLNHETWT
jgi:hypothetical protein